MFVYFFTKLDVVDLTNTKRRLFSQIQIVYLVNYHHAKEIKWLSNQRPSKNPAIGVLK